MSLARFLQGDDNRNDNLDGNGDDDVNADFKKDKSYCTGAETEFFMRGR